jgi:hypothetical protein
MTDDQQAAQASRLADDLLNGAIEIADFLGCKPREVYHLVKTKRLRVGRLGKKLIGSRTQIRRDFQKITGPPRADVQPKTDAAITDTS